MNRSVLTLFLLLAACSRGEQAADNEASPTAAGTPKSTGSAPARGAGASLAGLYEGPEGTPRSQLCIVEKGGKAQFGLVVWGSGLNSCSGAGEAVLRGDRLTLEMEGDETCTIAASLKDGTITLPAAVPQGCAYYCSPRARLGGASLTRTGDDASKAKDIAGDPLCG